MAELARSSALVDEHELLGGLLATTEGMELPHVKHYGDSSAENDAFVGDVALADVTAMGCVLVSGATAQAFSEATLAGRKLRVGECAFEACLTGDGAVVDVPLAMRTGDSEYVLMGMGVRHPTLLAWLRFIAAVEQDGVRPFDGVQVEEATGAMQSLLLWGPRAEDVLGDYVGDASLPEGEKVAQVLLDRLPCLMAAPPMMGGGAFLVFVPSELAVVLWRSLLSFTQVVPVGWEALLEHAAQNLPWTKKLNTTGRVRIGEDELAHLGLLREGRDFVGCRLLD